MPKYERLVAEEITDTLDRAEFENLSRDSFRIDVTDAFQRKLGECRTVQDFDDGSGTDRYRIRIARRLFEDGRDVNWQDTVRHEVAHAYVFSEHGQAVQPHGEEWKDAARRAGADPTAPPVVVFQGGNITTPVTLAWIQELADDFYLIAPDTPGEPGKHSSETPHEYGPWVVDVLDGFGIDQASMVGVSHGAGVLLEGAEYASDRIVAAALIVPAGFGTPFSVDLARIIVPALLYRFLPRRELLTRALAPMFTQSVSAIDEVIVETIGMALRTGDLAAEFLGPDSAEALAGCRAPMLVITGEDDPFFPGHRTCERARE